MGDISPSDLAGEYSDQSAEILQTHWITDVVGDLGNHPGVGTMAHPSEAQVCEYVRKHGNKHPSDAPKKVTPDLHRAVNNWAEDHCE